MISLFLGEHRFLSNFYESPIVLSNARVAPTVEHAYQAAKCKDPVSEETILTAATPGAAKRMGRHVELRPEWEIVKLLVMRTLLGLKFEPGSELGERLMATRGHLLIESNTWGDVFWGTDQHYRGHNWLGHLLMARRAELESM